MIKRVISFILAIVMSVSVLSIAVPEKKSEAATTWYSINNFVNSGVPGRYNSTLNKKLYPFMGEKVGQYYIYSVSDVNAQRLMVGTSAKNAKVVKSVARGRYYFSGGMLTDGTKLLFMIYDIQKNCRYVFKTILSNGTTTKILTLKGGIPYDLRAYYNGKLYFGIHGHDSLGGGAVYSYSFATKKYTTVKASGFDTFAGYGNKLVGLIGAPNLPSSDGDLGIMDLSTGKITKIHSTKGSTFITDAKVSKDKVYYTFLEKTSQNSVIAVSDFKGVKSRIYTTKGGILDYLGYNYSLLESSNGKFYKLTYADKALKAYTPAYMPAK